MTLKREGLKIYLKNILLESASQLGEYDAMQDIIGDPRLKYAKLGSIVNNCVNFNDLLAEIGQPDDNFSSLFGIWILLKLPEWLSAISSSGS